VEDEITLRKRVVSLLMQEEANVQAVATIADARKAVGLTDFDQILLDVNLPDGSGLDLLRESIFPTGTSTVIMTSQGGIETALEALRHGAADYLIKPFDLFELPLIFDRCKQRREARRRQEHDHAHASTASKNLFFGQGLTHVSAQLERILKTDNRLLDRPPPLLIVGETGTGKSTLARHVHYSGPRTEKPFVELNCATLSENLVESELFGHERGAFTDAKGTRIGLFEAANGGTLFLDEISSLPMTLQAKLLTAIEDGHIRRVGGNERINIDVRLIAATLSDLRAGVEQKTFRPDLYHRLNVLRLELPPLRAHRDDLVALADHLLDPLRRRYQTPDARLSDEGIARLKAYDWPGNVRELKHELERQLVLHEDGQLHLNTLPEGTGMRGAESSSDWLNLAWRFPDEGFSIEEAEMRLIRLAMQQAASNVSAAARLLGVNRDFIRYRLGK
jgi:DNA-binding NtrC family response regulator